MKNWIALNKTGKENRLTLGKVSLKWFAEVDKVLNKEEIDFTEEDFNFLKKVGVINGVGPAYFPTFLRIIITFFFRDVRAELHDVNYFIGGSEFDKKKADFGLLKYSFKSIINDLEKTILKLCFTSNILIDIILFAIYFIFGSLYILSKIIPLVIAFFCFLMVLGFGGRAFLYTK